LYEAASDDVRSSGGLEFIDGGKSWVSRLTRDKAMSSPYAYVLDQIAMAPNV
jgi:hypothetical protein